MECENDTYQATLSIFGKLYKENIHVSCVYNI